MKKSIVRIATVAALTATVSTSSVAGRGWEYGGHRHHSHHEGNRYGWVAPLVVLGVGAAAVAAMNPRPAPPPVIYVPPRPVYPMAGGFYCGSAGLYYPDTPYCPEGWQLVR